MSKKLNLNQGCIFIFILLIHFLIINGLEKQSIGLIWNNKINYRPDMGCKFESNDCLGMPSGHTEFVTFLALYTATQYDKVIVYYLSCISILLVALERYILKRHTILQIIAGFLFAFTYYVIYYKTKFSTISLGICLLVMMIYSIIIERQINNKIKQPLPSWINEDMIEKIKEKQNKSYVVKLKEIWFSSLNIFHSKLKLFIDWNDLELIMDNLIEKIKSQNKNYVGIVGIKTGGAILSDYISKKMGIKNFKIKLSYEKNKCNSGNSSNTFDVINTYVLDNNEPFIICEDTTQNIENQNIILIDEIIASGNTIQHAIDYLYKEKQAKYIYPVCLSINNIKKKHMKYPIDVMLDYHIIVWPWGYDN